MRDKKIHYASRSVQLRRGRLSRVAYSWSFVAIIRRRLRQLELRFFSLLVRF